MVFLILLLVIVFAQVVFRNFFGFSIVAIEELSMLLLAWFAFVAAAYSMRRDAHVSVDFFYRRFPPRIRKAIDISVDLLLIVFLAIVIELSFGIIGRQMRVLTPILRVPRGFRFVGLTVGSALMIVFVLSRLVDTIRNKYSQENGAHKNE